MADELSILNELITDKNFQDLLKIEKKINIFDILKVSNLEIRHSNVLAWLFDPTETHGLNDAVFKSLIQFCNKEYDKNYDCENIEVIGVKREFDYIDILINTNKLVICIENKIYSTQHDNQLQRYREHIETYFGCKKFLYLYLTLNGEEPEDKQWDKITYKHIIEIIQTAINGKKLLPETELIIKNYIEVIKEKYMNNEELSKKCVELYFKHKKAFDIINSNLPNESEYCKDIICEWCDTNKDKIIYDEKYNDRRFRWIRFRTDFLNEFFPALPQSKTTGWGFEHYIFYEITNLHMDKLYVDLVIDTYDLEKILPNDFERISKIVSVINGKKCIKTNDYIHIGNWQIDFKYDGKNLSELSSALSTTLENIKSSEKVFRNKIFHL